MHADPTPADCPDDINVQLFGPLLGEWVRDIGLEATLRIVRVHGGHPLYVPRTATPDHPIARLIGLDHLAMLCKRHDGQIVDVPKAHDALMDVRNRRIQAERYAKSVRALAKEHRLCERRIKQILQQGKHRAPPPPQGDLFAGSP